MGDAGINSRGRKKKHPPFHFTVAADAALNRIYNEEILAVAAYDYETEREQDALSIKSKFVFSLDAAYPFATTALGAMHALHAPEDARANLNNFLGGYLNDLDLSQSFITGSAAMSSVLRPECYGMFASHADFLGSYFPATCSDMAPIDIHNLIQMGRNPCYSGTPLFTIKTVEPPQQGPDGSSASRAFKEMRWSKGNPIYARIIPYEVVPGADVDIAIAEKGQKFEQIVRAHFDVIKMCFPSATLVRVERGRSGIMYRVVSAKAPGIEKGFRVVEMYPASWAHICAHHMGMVRLAYTAPHADEPGALPTKNVPKFFLTASCLKSAIQRSTPTTTTSRPKRRLRKRSC